MYPKKGVERDPAASLTLGIECRIPKRELKEWEELVALTEYVSIPKRELKG